MQSEGTHMAKKLIFAILITLILVVSVGTYLYMQKTQSDMQKAVSDFNLIFKYGVGAKNELNTYNGTYTRDMIIDPSITTSLNLTVEEKWQILQKINEIDFFNIPSNFSVNPSLWTLPQLDYYVKVEYGSQIKEVSWNSRSLMESNTQSSLEQLVSYIESIIQQKPEYKALPTPRAGYA
jgi:hypothetical protein